MSGFGSRDNGSTAFLLNVGSDMTNAKSTLILLLAILSFSCEQNKLGTVDVSTDVPFLASPVVSPDSVYIDGLTPTDSLYSISVVASVKVKTPRSGLSVTAAALAAGSGQAVAQAILHDDGVAPDQVANDSVYAGKLDFRIKRTAFGRYRVRYVVRKGDGTPGNVVERPLILARANSSPALANAGIRPSTPPGSSSDSTRVLLTVVASDSDGIGDIRQVTVTPRNTIDSSGRAMFDDGNLAQGDQVAGDGVFSCYVWIRPTGSLQDVEFVFAATDRRNAQSNEVRRSYANHTPIILRLIVPSTIQRPATDSTLVRFFQTVADSDGLGDIDSVYFRNFTSTSPTNFPMFDDGNLTIHGDSVANDGTYSRIVSISASTTPGPKEFHFYVVDRFGARDSLVRTITVQ